MSLESESFELKGGERLVCDPCYIKSVGFAATPRYDALRCVKVLHDGDDGEYEAISPLGTKTLGVDSGRIWVMEAEFDCDVAIDSGISGYLILPNDIPLEDIILNESEFED